MKALTLHQPWASLIAEGPKTVETRSWPAPPWLVGQRIAIHAGKRKYRIRERDDPEMYRAISQMHGSAWQDGIPLGAVVATARLAGCFRVTGWSGNGEPVLEGTGNGAEGIRPDLFGDFRTGRWLWVLDNIRRLEPPAPAIGRRMLWDWEPDDGQEELNQA